ncbi:MAG: dicarboxylate/amino acid:cation symporter [Gluconacetobacter sp.]|uniref:Dicarboxylate/amino acid:cation symporter n=1 Tax=Gluconacetobacter dulcium TaxID=2729096 RepID=A0A7W4JXZ4_9PROT|nr:dicarboxylate/amino acid:cation symporter [Gluconacetobacter dulcium]MBB2196667.1 dicarboxylate/amino acid:cation symporter [Gluconacetobacter dulcium]
MKTHSPTEGKRRTFIVLIALGLGMALGLLGNMVGGATEHLMVAISDFVGHAFIRLVKLIISPLVASAIISGFSGLSSQASIRREIGFLILWIAGASVTSVALGLAMGNLLHPGMSLAGLAASQDASGFKAPVVTLYDEMMNIIPTSVVDAMARNDILQVTVFSIFFGIGLSKISAGDSIVQKLSGEVFAIMLKITNLIMAIIPFVVVCSVASVCSRYGTHAIVVYAKVIVEFYISVAAMAAIVMTVGYLFLGRGLFRLIRLVAEPVLVGFATASSEAVFSDLIERLEEAGVDRRHSGIILPLCYSFNQDGAMLFQSFSVILIADAYGIHLTAYQQIYILFFLMLSTKGIASVPRGALIVLGSVLPDFGLPPQGILLLLGIDHFLDMGRTGISIFSNAVAMAAIASPRTSARAVHQER